MNEKLSLLIEDILKNFTMFEHAYERKVIIHKICGVYLLSYWLLD
jgi:hypothetical protein